MASKTYIQSYADGTKQTVRRTAKQGRKPSGLGKPELFRLYAEDEEILNMIKEKLGIYYNKNEIVRDAVHAAVKSIYTELLKS